MSDVKVLIVDDHQIVSEGIAQLVDELEGFRVVGRAENGAQALEFIELLKPHITLMDVDMPVLNGLEATRKIKSAQMDTKVIILTMHGEPTLIKRMMEIGADGYLLKNTDKEDLHKALLRVSEGKTFFSSDAAQAIISGENAAESKFTVNQDNVLISTLSDREIEILKLVAEGLSNKEIGDQLFISHRTVDTHRTNMMKKLDIHNTAGLVKLAIKAGILS